MEEKRRSRRLPIELTLDISSLFKQDNVKVENVHAPIEVINISKHGIGFKTESVLPVGYYFNARLQLGDSESVLNCVLRIMRESPCESEDGFEYGSEFVGLAPILDFIFDDYEASLDKSHES